MTALNTFTPIQPTLEGVTLTFTQATANDQAPISTTSRTLVFVKNSSTSQNVTFNSNTCPWSAAHLAGHDVTISATGISTSVVGPMLNYRWADATGAVGNVEITSTTPANISIAVVNVPWDSL